MNIICTSYAIQLLSQQNVNNLAHIECEQIPNTLFCKYTKKSGLPPQERNYNIVQGIFPKNIQLDFACLDSPNSPECTKDIPGLLKNLNL